MLHRTVSNRRCLASLELAAGGDRRRKAQPVASYARDVARSPRVILLAGLVAAASVATGACAATIELDVGAQPINESPTPASTPRVDSRLQPDEALATPTPAPTEVAAAPSPTPLAEPAPAATPTPVPELPYGEAIDTYLADIEAFWAGAAPALVDGGFVPVDAVVPYDPTELDNIPACAGEVGPLEIYRENAFYCEPDDYIAWDDAVLFPDLYRTYGDFSVGLVLAHEYGHAIQSRAEAIGPTVFLELHADCLTGAWAGSVADGSRPGVPFESTDLDNAIGGFLTFADPRGTPAGDPGAHGTAFDRVNAFAQGFEGELPACAQYLDDPPQTASILIPPSDPSGGDLPLDQLIPLLVTDLQVYLDGLGRREIDPSFDAPGEPVEFGSGIGDPPACGGAELSADAIDGSAYYCETDRTVYIDRFELQELWVEIGDFAPAYGVAHSYSMSVAVESIAADPTAAVLAADCLVGVWARDIFDDARLPAAARTHQIELSAGDLDEGIVGLVLVPPIGPSLTASPGLQTFDRVSAFSAGFFRGVSQCPFSPG